MSMPDVNHTMQMCSCIFDIQMLVLARPAFGGEDAAAVGNFEIAIRELVMPFGIRSILVVYRQVPFTIFKEPVPLYKFVLLPC
jgi:hypothetical protein